jgi:hypothetical protein
LRGPFGADASGAASGAMAPKAEEDAHDKTVEGCRGVGQLEAFTAGAMPSQPEAAGTVMAPAGKAITGSSCEGTAPAVKAITGSTLTKPTPSADAGSAVASGGCGCAGLTHGGTLVFGVVVGGRWSCTTDAAEAAAARTAADGKEAAAAKERAPY